MTSPRETSDQFIQTTEEIGALIRGKYNKGNHIKKAIEGMKNTTLTRPGVLTPENNGHIDPVDQSIFERRSTPT